MNGWMKLVTVVYYASSNDRVKREFVLANGKTLMNILEELAAETADVIYMKVRLVEVLA